MNWAAWFLAGSFVLWVAVNVWHYVERKRNSRRIQELTARIRRTDAKSYGTSHTWGIGSDKNSEDLPIIRTGGDDA